MTLSITALHCCRVLFIIVLSVVVLNVVMLSVLAPFLDNIVPLSVFLMEGPARLRQNFCHFLSFDDSGDGWTQTNNLSIRGHCSTSVLLLPVECAKFMLL